MPTPSKRTALITGGAHGIGAATAQRLGSEGTDVYVVDIAEEAGRAVCQSIRHEGGSATFIHSDLFTPTGAELAVKEALDRSGGMLHTVINNAFSYDRGELLADISSEHFVSHLQNLVVSYQAVVRESRASLAQSHLASVVNLASIRGKFAGGRFGAYSVAKAAVAQMTKILAEELGPEGIRVNAVAPGVIATTRTGSSNQTKRDRTAHITPLRRIGTPDDVAKVISFLASPAADFITGQTVVVDGGLSLPLQIDSAALAVEFERQQGPK